MKGLTEIEIIISAAADFIVSCSISIRAPSNDERHMTRNEEYLDIGLYAANKCVTCPFAPFSCFHQRQTDP
jgi:hypothetical protein